ncbi:glutamine--fructose-6-phosphate transaminase (isomerizing) [bacterium]|nr:glutamine--fructose-6-phosphate transaminase (isomerizing) [bacterium]
MCGIVGYVGKKVCTDILLSGLKSLEYRGYDSAGIAVIDENKVKIFKSIGKIQNLFDKVENEKSSIKNPLVGIGHIRWATHGKPTVANAHPHTCNCGNLAIVHNGIIENYKELREELTLKGAIFKSETDTETVAHLIAYEYEKSKDLLVAVQNATKKLKGAYALCIMHRDNPDEIIATKCFAPLLIGVGKDESIVGSDIPAIIGTTNKIIYLDDMDIAVVKKDGVVVYNHNGDVVNKKVVELSIKEDSLNKMGYKHFMIKEIFEQPDIIRNALNGRLKDINSKIVFPELDSLQSDKKIDNIKIVACGTSLHAGIIAKYIIEDLTGITVEVESSSEYIYRNNTTNASSLVIGISQSGETADTITAMRLAKDKGAKILIITNRPDSSICKLADSVIPVNAGIEVSVAATKSYTAQLIVLYLFAIYLCEVKGKHTDVLREIKQELLTIPSKIEYILNNKSEIEGMAKSLSNYKDFIYIARGTNLATAQEGALKLKEISYINATAYPAGELKHGPIAMLDENMPVLAILIPNHITFDKMISNCEEAKARNAKLIALTSSNDERLDKLFDYIIRVPEVSEILSPLITCVPLQLLAYYIANYLGKDVDQPRNLAKSVTVE